MTSKSVVDVEELQVIFRKIDKNGDGLLDPSELKAALKENRLPCTEQAVTTFFKRADVNRSNTVDFVEFVDIVRENEKFLRNVFDTVDANHDGTISKDELKGAFVSQGLDVSPQQLQLILNRLGCVKDGNINFDKFYKLLRFAPTTDLKEIFDYWRVVSVDFADVSVAPTSSPLGHSAQHALMVLTAGGLAGAVSRTSTAPLDRLKLLLQLVKGHPTSHGTVEVSPTGVKHRVGLVSLMKQIYVENGIPGFFRGNGVNCLKIAPESAAKFLAYDWFKSRIANDPAHVTTQERFAAGAAAGCLAQASVYPLEVIKTRIGATHTPMSISGVARDAFRSEGVRGLYKGLGVSMVGIIPFAGTDLMVYETLKNRYIAMHPGMKDPPLLVLSGVGVISSTAALLTSFPFTVVRSRLQVQGVKGAKGAEFQYKGATDAFKQLVRQEGFTALYKGIFPAALKVLPAVSISYVIYESAQRMIKPFMT